MNISSNNVTDDKLSDLKLNVPLPANKARRQKREVHYQYLELMSQFLRVLVIIETTITRQQ